MYDFLHQRACWKTLIWSKIRACVFDAGVPTEARNGPNSAGRFPAKSGTKDLQVSGSAEGVTGAYSTRTPRPFAPGASRGRDEAHSTVYQRTQAKDGISRDADDAAEFH